MWQLLRETPPGYGGVERVAHELADACQSNGLQSVVFTLCSRKLPVAGADPLAVSYKRVSLPSLSFGRLVLPWPSRTLIHLLLGVEPLHVHLPCPGVLLLALIARVLRPRRCISLHWHSFLEPASTPAGLLYWAYQQLAERLLPCFARIVTTSPVLQNELINVGASPRSLRLLPCSLPAVLEQQAIPIAAKHLASPPFKGLRVISIGRLHSYKRVDWLIEALAAVPDEAVQLDVVGDGPDLQSLEQLALALVPGRVRFHGRVDEATKFDLLSRSDLLVLAANRCNEAFGIVQLEAMACAVPAVAFTHPRSGMAWVSQLDCLPWSGSREGLPQLIHRLAADPALLVCARREAHQRYHECFARSLWLERLPEVFAV